MEKLRFTKNQMTLRNCCLYAVIAILTFGLGITFPTFSPLVALIGGLLAISLSATRWYKTIKIKEGIYGGEVGIPTIVVGDE